MSIFDAIKKSVLESFDNNLKKEKVVDVFKHLLFNGYFYLFG